MNYTKSTWDETETEIGWCERLRRTMTEQAITEGWEITATSSVSPTSDDAD